MGFVWTAPYMHDGSLETLEDVVPFMPMVGIEILTSTPILAPIDLNDEDVDNMVAFLLALSKPADVSLLETSEKAHG